MNTTIEQQINSLEERDQAAARDKTIREICQDIDIRNEFILPPSPETREYVGGYVDLRAFDPDSAATQYPEIEAAIRNAEQYREHLRVIGLGHRGLVADGLENGY